MTLRDVQIYFLAMAALDTGVWLTIACVLVVFVTLGITAVKWYEAAVRRERGGDDDLA